MKEIGGYLQLEQATGGEYHEDVRKVNLGRTALLLLLEAAGAHTVWLPHFLCGCVSETCRKDGITVRFYPVDRNFLPAPENAPAEGEYLYLVNYYGQLTDEKIRELSDTYQRVIVDQTHAFFQKMPAGVPALYSLRKFFGLSDGAYIYPGALPLGTLSELPRDHSAGRMEHILGRYEEDAGTYYQTMLNNAHALEQEPPKRMSLLTENLLRSIDYTAAKAAREANYGMLDSLLGADNTLTLHSPEGPFTYPFYYRDGIRLRKALAQKKIFVPTYWGNVIADMPKDSLEYDYAANILPLPCDQRYQREDMVYLAGILRQCIKKLETEHE